MIDVCIFGSQPGAEDHHSFFRLDNFLMVKDKEGQVHYEKIEPTKTGNYTYYFNKWIKLPEVPNFAAEG